MLSKLERDEYHLVPIKLSRTLSIFYILQKSAYYLPYFWLIDWLIN